MCDTQKSSGRTSLLKHLSCNSSNSYAYFVLYKIFTSLIPQWTRVAAWNNSLMIFRPSKSEPTPATYQIFFNLFVDDIKIFDVKIAHIRAP